MFGTGDKYIDNKVLFSVINTILNNPQLLPYRTREYIANRMRLIRKYVPEVARECLM